MKDVENVRTFALIAHNGAGKTSLAEAMLFVAGETTRLGKVDEGNSVMDFEPEEVKRKTTISTAFNSLTWKKKRLNIIDTPGDFNFIADTKLSMEGADSVVILVDAIDGVRVQTEKVAEFANEFNHPRMIFISKMDRERADFYKVVQDIQNDFGNNCVPLLLPIGEAEDFKGVADLMNGKAYLYTQGESGKFETAEIPSEVADRAAEYKEQLIEAVAEANDELLEKYLEGEDLTPEEILTGLRNAVSAGNLIPIACGSGPGNVGVQPLLDIIADYMPSPAEHAARKMINPGQEAEHEVEADPAGPLAAKVIKTVSDPYAGRLSIMRVFSGTLSPDSGFYNVKKQAKERFGALLKLKGKSQSQAESAGPGDVVAVAKLKETTTGDTLGPDKSSLVFPGVELPPAVYSLAIEPKSKGDEDKIFSSLTRLMEEDPTLKLERREATRESVMSGMGEVHIEATIEKLKRKFGVEVNLKTPKIPYKETIKGKARVQGKYKKQTGGRGQFGDCWIEMEPLPGGGFEFVDRIVGGVIPKTFIPAVEKGIYEASQEGVLAGYPMIDFKVDLVDGSYHSVDSSEMAFKIAGSMAYKKAAADAKPTLLEPIMYMEIIVPDDCMGDVIGDLNGRRGKVLGMDAQGKNQLIKAKVPMAEVQTYAPELRSMTAGRGFFTMVFDHYEEVPAQLQEKIVEAAKKENE